MFISFFPDLHTPLTNSYLSGTMPSLVLYTLFEMFTLLYCGLYVMVYIISNVTGMIRDHMEKTNTMHSILRYAEHTIVLAGYQEKMKKGVDWYSQPYYTHLHGYKMCVYVQLRPSQNYLYVYSHLLRGEYDAGLKWPFRGTVVVQLLNQLSDDNHYDYVFDYSQASDDMSQRVTSGERSEYMYPSIFCLPLNSLDYNSSKKCQYLKNDCLIFNVSVKNV